MKPETQTPSWSLVEQASALALALFARAWVAFDLSRLPFHDSPISDARSYLDWAHRIAAGDVLGRAEGLFYQAPLYPYFLATLELLVGPGHVAASARVVQVVLASLAVLGLARATSLVAGRSAARAVALLGALYPPALAADTQIQKEGLALTLGCLALALWLRDVEEGSGKRIFAVALALGVLSLVRETALLLLAALLLVELRRRFMLPAGENSKGGRRVAAVALGAFLALAPGMVRGYLVSGELALTTAQGGPNFYIGNHRGATGSYVPLVIGHGDPAFERDDARRLAEAARQRRLGDREVSRYWFERGLEFWRESPVAAVRLTGRKARLLLHRIEIADVEDFEIQREASVLLRALWPALSFGTLLPLAAAGLVLSPLRPVARRLAIWLAAAAAGTIAFYILGRYRVLLLPPLFVSAALFAESLRSRRPASRARIAGALVAAVLLAAAGNAPRATLALERRGMPSVNLGVAYAVKGDLPAAEHAYRRALDIEPGLFEAELNLGNLLRVTGRANEAIPHLERALARSPGDADALRELQAARAQARVPAANSF